MTAKETSEQMAFPDLRRFIKRLRSGGYDVRELEVALHNKLSIPCVPLVMPLEPRPMSLWNPVVTRARPDPVPMR